ncbi:TonB-dependent receptor [Crocinitomix algicola]|uniref:TonB-dependent receptor n=1 Tax=Crocinitomix algicola TaxID=1740263 RepID=UPI00082C8573|nr:TonB-dependent receptor [Crocinitomix algicola]
MKTLNTFFLFCFLLSNWCFGQDNFHQTVRGQLLDADTKTPIIGATILIPDSNPLLGAKSNLNGEFKIENVPVGRTPFRITASGYLDINLPSILVESGKEKILNLEMTGDINILNKVEITANSNPLEVANKMATVSAKAFSVEETNRYAGSLNDPARMVSGFAGVTGDAEGNNDIVVRGNSPRGVLWRLEGIDIPNPNHFSDNGATGGPVNALNGAVLANSDFFSGAFAPEYGNALSGVFDVKMRQGNNEKREYSFSAGVIGIDATIEGPFSEGYRGSYMANYRYSSIALLDKVGILDFNGIPIYQDGAFKIHLPTKKGGTFSLIGFGGKSAIDETDQDDETEEIYGKYNFRASVGMLGLKHIYLLSPKLYIKSYLAATSSYNGGEGYFNTKNEKLVLSEREGFTDNQIKSQSILNYKYNAKHIFQVGATFSNLRYNYFYEEDYDDQNGILTPQKKAKGDANLLQAFMSWKYRATNQLSFVSGLHYTHFYLNNNKNIEPRLGLKWQLTPRQNFSLGIGMHSKVEAVSVYLDQNLTSDFSIQPQNKNLDFSKSSHFVLGYGIRINEHLFLRSEIYYQHLFDVPISQDTAINFSMINSASGIPNMALINDGTGNNYGIELTVERPFENNFYYLLTGSIYKSEYSLDQQNYQPSRYDANYALNFLLGKEFNLGAASNKTLGINTKISVIGGNRYTPIDLNASQEVGYTVLDENQIFGKKGEDIFFINLGLTYRCDMKRASHSFKIDIQNLTNNQAVVSEYFNGRTNQIEYNTQLSLIPNLIYTIKF